MSIEIIRGATNQPAACDELVNILSNNQDITGVLFIGYPIVPTPDGPHTFDGLLLSKDSGATVIHIVEGTDISDFATIQDNSANKLEAKLRLTPELMKGRTLRIPINTISFAPAVANVDQINSDENRIVNSNGLVNGLTQSVWKHREADVYERTLSVLANVSSIRRSRSGRSPKNKTSLGSALRRLEDSIAVLDTRQSRAVVETVDGIQRIRGLAGSGKTIVLALKAAYFHTHNPDWRIAVTFNTRSLKGQFRRLINNFCLGQAHQEPDWQNLRVLNAWGAPGGTERSGMYYEFCRAHDVPYLDFQSAQKLFGKGDEFAQVCEHATRDITETQSLYDVILIDEAQDFSPAFLRMCYLMLNDTKRLVYAYDELQNLSGDSLPAPDTIFAGLNHESSLQYDAVSGNASPFDIVLEKCYRNSRPVLVTAHSLGFGIYRNPPLRAEHGLIQMFENSHLWTEVGYQVDEGTLRDGQLVVLSRSPATSPPFLEEHSSLEDIIQFITFENEGEQAQWLADAVSRNLQQDELRHEDILVINPDPRTTRKRFGTMRRLLWEQGINSHLAGIDADPDIFFQAESVTFTGIYRAKGNEAGMVYIANAQDCHSSDYNLATLRSQLFTAITRSKAWVRILGFGHGMEELKREYEELRKHEFRLRFVYPTADQREKLRIIHRDMTPQEHQRLQDQQGNFEKLIEDLAAGRIRREDLKSEAVDKFMELLSN